MSKSLLIAAICTLVTLGAAPLAHAIMGSDGPAQPIPEPGAALLFVAGGILVGAALRRRDYDS